MNDPFYRAFEDLHRGDRSLIKQRHRVYEPLLHALAQMDPHPEALDLGCGRGEWLELLEENGVAGIGVDHDPDMLTGAKESRLKVIHGEFQGVLERQPDDSLMLVSAFHLVEHISFSDLKLLTAQALRVLKPGGVLIMETPNPENIMVSAFEFYLDPTHIRPVPPKLLAFLPRYFKFARTEIIRCRESTDVDTTEDITLKQVLAGVSPDYAVVAQKQGDPQKMALLDPFFARGSGRSFEDMVSVYDHQAGRRRKLEADLLDQARQTTAHAEARAVAAEKLAARMQGEAEQATAHLAAVFNSLSWRITRPLRLLKSMVVRSPESTEASGASPAPGPSPMSPEVRRIHKALTKILNRRDRERD